MRAAHAAALAQLQQRLVAELQAAREEAAAQQTALLAQVWGGEQAREGWDTACMFLRIASGAGVVDVCKGSGF